jgi:hypothetical protein
LQHRVLLFLLRNEKQEFAASWVVNRQRVVLSLPVHRSAPAAPQRVIASACFTIEPTRRTMAMAKEQRSTREKRKPKADKIKASPAASAFPAAPGMGKGKSSAPPKKGR